MEAERIPVRNVPADDLPEVLEMLLERLGLQLWQERTPDYTAYELRPALLQARPAHGVGEVPR